MGYFMGYMVQVAIIMTVLYLVYKLLLSGLSFHSFNRKIILGIYIVSWLLPVFTDMLLQPATKQAAIEIGGMELTGIILSEEPQESPVNWANIVAIVYLTGILLLTVTTTASILRMARIIRNGIKIGSKEYTVKVSESAPGPFSWGNYIIVRPADIDDSLDMVISHEKAHLERKHWIDLIPARFTLILQWFSPAAWLLARELREVHEFEVDEIAGTENLYEYQLMLIKKTAGSRFPVFADSLNHSQIKKRLTMMRKKSNPKRRIVAATIPLAAVAASLLISQPVVARIVERLSNADIFAFAEGKISENDLNLQIGVIEDASVSYESSSLAEGALQADLPTIAEGETSNESLSDDADAETQETALDRGAVTYFVDGKEYNGSVPDIDPSTIASVVVVKNDPRYPDGKVMINTKSADSSEMTVVTKTADSSAALKVQNSPEKIAQFKGGEKELLAFLTENISYPSTAVVSEKPVRVIISFNILTDGKVDDIKVLKSGGEAFDNEAVKVVAKTSGRWEPAEENGRKIVSQFTIPITFSAKP